MALTACKALALSAMWTWRRSSATAGHSPCSWMTRCTASAISLFTTNTSRPHENARQDNEQASAAKQATFRRALGGKGKFLHDEDVAVR